MHIGTGLYETVAFIGFADRSKSTGIRFEGTGFFISYDGNGYLITARHVAKIMEDAPFLVRVNRGGSAFLLEQDTATWQYHPDPLVDIAALPLVLPTSSGFNSVYLEQESLLSKEAIVREGIDIGAPCYTLGLFHFISGQKRNLPMAHAGNVALMPPAGETIPVLNKQTNRTEFVEAYLVESSAINGSSGSPVFVRPAITLMNMKTDQGAPFNALWPEAKLFLLGVFQGAWFAPPDDTLAKNVRAPPGSVVPVGLGLVTPAYKIIELLEVQSLKDQRKRDAGQVMFVKQTGVSESASTPANNANSAHREDFIRLAGTAARKHPRED